MTQKCACEARFRNMTRRHDTKQCVFKCSPNEEDVFEHYAACPYVLRFARRLLNLATGSCALTHFLLAKRGMTATRLTLTAVLVYAVFRTTNAVRGKEDITETVAADMLEEYCKTAVKGHTQSSSVLHEALVGRFLRH